MPDRALAFLLTKKLVPEEVRTQVLTAGYTDAPSWASGIERVELETLFLTGTTFDPAAHTAGSPPDYLIKPSWPSNYVIVPASGTHLRSLCSLSPLRSLTDTCQRGRSLAQEDSLPLTPGTPVPGTRGLDPRSNLSSTPGTPVPGLEVPYSPLVLMQASPQ